MAYRRKYIKKKSYRTRKTFMRKRRGRRYTKYSPNKLSKSIPTTFPNTLLSKFIYTDSKIYQPSSGGSSANVYCATSLYDPDATGAGTGVLYYNNLINANLYRTYKVYGAKVTISMVNESNFPCCAQIAYGTRSTLGNILAANPGVVDVRVSGKRNFIANLGAATGSSNIRKIKLWIDPAQINGKSRKGYLMDTDFDYAYNNSFLPIDSRQVDFFVNVLGGVPAGTAVAPSVSVTVQIKYYAKLLTFGMDTVQV